MILQLSQQLKLVSSFIKNYKYKEREKYEF